MKTLQFVAISLLMLPLLGLAQQGPPANPLSSDARGAWENVRNLVSRAAEKMPEENYAFKPVPEVRSFGQLIGHIADAQYSICAGAKGVARPDVQVEKTKTTKADLAAALKDSDAFCDGAFADLTDAKAVELVKVFGRERTRLAVLNMNTGHDMEHYGNIVTYMRIKGLVPPSSEPRPAPPKAK
jgi:uncharacterized damage-inducible protein DinB